VILIVTRLIVRCVIELAHVDAQRQVLTLDVAHPESGGVCWSAAEGRRGCFRCRRGLPGCALEKPLWLVIVVSIYEVDLPLVRAGI
jgi:hypothetical protein